MESSQAPPPVESNPLLLALQQADANYWTEKREARAIRRGFVASSEPRTMRITQKKSVEPKSLKIDKENGNRRKRYQNEKQWRISQVQISRFLALALACAVACGSATWACAFGLALFCSDTRLRENLKRWLERVRLPSLYYEEDQKEENEMCTMHRLPPRLARLAVPHRHNRRKQRTIEQHHHPLTKYCGRWTLDSRRSDSPMPQLEVLGVPWAARMAAARAPRTKRIRLDGKNAWVETTFTSVVARSNQTLILDSSPQSHTHPVDRSHVTVWSAIGTRPKAAASLSDLDSSSQFNTNYPPDAVISVMAYKRNGAVATIVRTIEDDGDTYHVENHLTIPLGIGGKQASRLDNKENKLKHIVTHSYFKRDRDELLIG